MRSEQLSLTAGPVDRDTAARSEAGLLRSLATDPQVRVLTVRGSSVVCTASSTSPRLHTCPAPAVAGGAVPAEAADETTPDQGGTILAYLGKIDQQAYLARLLPEPAGEGQHVLSLRDAGEFLSGAESALATAAIALANWHRGHAHCPGCGNRTEVIDAGWVRRCPVEGTNHFPRTDPAVIMAITDPQQRLLLARSAHWPEGRFSVPAGFVEPGEALENAVRREVAEETSIRVDEVTYQGTQPWPFPASLMCAFTGTTSDIDAQPDGTEIAEAEFFTRAEAAGLWRAGQMRPPGVTSIARALITEWFGAPLPEPEPERAGRH